MDGTVRRALGEGHAGRRRHEPQRLDLVRSRRQLSQRRDARDRTLHADESGHHRLRRYDHRRQDVHASVEDEHGALSPPGEKRASDGFQVRGVRRGIALWPVAETAAGALKRELLMRTRLFTGLAVLVITAAAISGQGKYSPPRLADGHPDLQGTYDLATLT